MFSSRELLPLDWSPKLEANLTADCNLGKTDMLLQTDISEAVNNVDQLAQIVE